MQASILEPDLYTHLRGIAARYLSRERPDHTLQPTALVHEAYLRLQRDGQLQGPDREGLIALAAHAMRLVLVDHARRRRADKRGGTGQRVPLDDTLLLFESSADGLIELDSALEKLERRQPGLARIVDLRFFGGLTEEETARELGVSVRSVRRGWAFARLWLAAELERG